MFVEFPNRFYDIRNNLFYLSFLRIFYLNSQPAGGKHCDSSKKEMQRPDQVEGLSAGSFCDNIFFLCDIFAYESYTNEYQFSTLGTAIRRTFSFLGGTFMCKNKICLWDSS